MESWDWVHWYCIAFFGFILLINAICAVSSAKDRQGFAILVGNLFFCAPFLGRIFGYW